MSLIRRNKNIFTNRFSFMLKKLMLLTIIFYQSSFYALHAQDNFDVRTVKKIQATRTAAKNNLYKTISGSAVPISGLVPVGLLIKGFITNKKTEQREALVMAGSNALCVALTFGMKEVFNRPRPAEHDASIIALKNATNGSFPSGHTSIAFATATSLSLLHPKWYVIVPAYSWASLVGYARMYVGVHYPTDVLAGAILGSGTAWLSHKLNNNLQKAAHKQKRLAAY
jgi:membrane-associated phospholipid phosphatase